METPNLITTTDLYHHGRTRKLDSSHHTQTISLMVGHGNPVFPTLGKFPRWSGMETPRFLHFHFWVVPTAVGHRYPKFPTLSLGRLSLPGQPWKPPTFSPAHLGGGMENKSFPRCKYFWMDRWKPHFSHTSQSGILPLPGWAWKPQVSHTRTWETSIAWLDPNSLHLGEFSLERPRKPEFSHTLGRRICPWST
jgi:hypothetical protein